MERMRHDKDYKSHTNIEELHELYALDPVSYANKLVYIYLLLVYFIHSYNII